MANDEADGYRLQRDQSETDRLDLQNKVFNKAVGYLLHSTIRSHLPSDARIAELATGTGAFLVDLTKDLGPGYHFEGYDISADSFLSSDKLPKHVTLSVSNAKDTAPRELQGKYDVVCIRFINVAMLPPDWSLVAQNIYSLLKPGGSVQWIEGNLTQLRTPLHGTPGSSTAAMEEGFHRFIGGVPHLDWASTNLSGVLKDVGFEDVLHEVTSSDRDPDTREQMSEVCNGACFSGLRRLIANGALDVAEAESLMQRMKDEVKGGAYARCDMHVWAARKPI